MITFTPLDAFYVVFYASLLHKLTLTNNVTLSHNQLESQVEINDQSLDVPNSFNQDLINSFNFNETPINLRESVSAENLETSTSRSFQIQNDEWQIAAALPENQQDPKFALVNKKLGIQKTQISEIRHTICNLIPQKNNYIIPDLPTFQVSLNSGSSSDVSLFYPANNNLSVSVPLTKNLSKKVLEELALEQFSTLETLEQKQYLTPFKNRSIEIQPPYKPLVEKLLTWREKSMPSLFHNEPRINVILSCSTEKPVTGVVSPTLRPNLIHGPNLSSPRFNRPTQLQAIRRDIPKDATFLKFLLEERKEEFYKNKEKKRHYDQSTPYGISDPNQEILDQTCLLYTYLENELQIKIEQDRQNINAIVLRLMENSSSDLLKLSDGKPTFVGIIGSYHSLKNMRNQNSDAKVFHIDHAIS